MFNKLFTTVLLSFFCLQTLSALDLVKQDKWISYSKAKIVRIKDSAGKSILKVTFPKTEKKITYRAIDCLFPAPIDLSGFKQMEMNVKTSQKVKISMRINSRKENIFPGWSKQFSSSMPSKFVFPREAMKLTPKLNLKEATSVTIGFGLWEYDTTKEELEVEIKDAFAVEPEERFLIPRPTAGTVMDGVYKKDWGLENNLYLWTPPEYVRLAGKKHSVGKRVPHPEELSGSFSFMHDSDYLYFLALAADKTPCAGTNPAAPWSNDSIELFLVSGVRQDGLLTQEPIANHGFQIVFDASAGGAPTLFKNGQKISNFGIQYKLLKEDVTVNGSPVPGYVLEAAIPLKLFSKKPERGSMIAYCINLNDSEGASLRTNPENARPSVTIYGYSKAYLEYQGSEKFPEFVFGTPAADMSWPDAYHADGKRFWDDSILQKESGTTFEKIFLNGFWAVQGMSSESASPDPANWHYAPLPTNIGWHAPIYKRHPQKKETLAEGRFEKITKKGNNTFFWYERTFTAQNSWKGKVVRLVFDHVEKEAVVCINGKTVGTVSLMQPSVDISPFLKFGEKNRIDLQLFTMMNLGSSLQNGTGIAGDLYLEISKNAPVIEDLWIQKADGLTGEFKINVAASPLPQGKLRMELLSPEKQTLFRAEKEMQNGKTAEFSGTCPKFPQWSLENPTLCTLKVQIRKNDGTLMEERTKKFGFRNFKTSGAHFTLNGRIVRLRTALPSTPSLVYDPGRLEHLKELGFNAIYLHAGSNGGYNTPLFDLCDEKGFLIMAPVRQTYSDEQTVQAVKTIRNHPSVIGYLSDPYGQLTSNGFGLNPFETSDTYMPSSRVAKEQEAFMEKRDALFKKADPERGYISQGTGNWKNFMRMLHHYPTNGLNLQDRMMYHTPWANRENKKLPLYLLEAGTVNLYNMDTTHPENTFPVMENRRQVPRLLVYEAASRYLGGRSFENWMDWSALLFHAVLRDMRLNGVDGFCAWTEELNNYPANTDVPQGIKDNRRLSCRYFTEPVRGNMEHSWMRMNSWYYKLRALADRQWPEEYGQGKLAPEETMFAPFYKNEMQPLYITITGEKNDIFTQDHNFYAGETVKKQIAVVNDTADRATVKGTLTLLVNGKEKHRLTFQKSVAQGGIEFIPFEFELPSVSKKTSASVVMESEGRKEEFALTIFPKHNPRAVQQAASGVKLGIATGKSASAAERAGLKGVPVELSKGIPPGLDALIVERGALTRSTDTKTLSNFLNRGGRILIFEQSDASLYSHRANEQRLEHAFIADAAHPALQGLTDQDLSFWRGRAETVSNEKKPSEAFRHNQSVALETPHLTNRNIVAGYVLENPSYGSIRPLVTGGYDRNFAVVLEGRSGKGFVLFCQADVSSRYGKDPAATLLTDNLLKTVLSPLPEQISGVCYTGGAEGKQFLSRLGIRIVNESPVGVAGPGKNEMSKLEKCSVILRLPSAEFLPPGVRIGKRHLTQNTFPYFWNGGYYQFQMLKGILPGTDTPESAGASFRGLSSNDFYLFENPQMETFEFTQGSGDSRSRHGTAAEITRNGKKYILCSLTPETVKSGEELKKIYRVWSVLFHNQKIANAHRLSFESPAWDLTNTDWQFLTDPDGSGEKNGFADGNFGNRKTRPIKTGLIWEDQGVTEANPNLTSDPSSAYDGYGWYFTTLNLSSVPTGTIYLHVNGIRDIATFSRTEHQSTLFINGKKMPEAVGIYNAYLGGRGARLWQLESGNVLKKGKNLIAIRVYNNGGAGGIHKNPVRFEFEGKNNDQLFPYEFNRSKYTNDFFWCW